MMPFAAIVPAVGLLPEWILHTDAFGILATFVALNSLMYATLAVLKVLPRGYALSRFNGRNRRVDNRSIHPEPPTPGVAMDATAPVAQVVDGIARPTAPGRRS